MSGFLVTRNEGADTGYLRRRGRDVAESLSVEGFEVHRFLTCVDSEDPLTFGDDGVVVLWDGQIFESGADTGQHLLGLYGEHGEDFARHLDGDFAVAVYDFHRRVAVQATDPFGSKPLFVRGAECASYPSGLEGGPGVGRGKGAERLPPNTLRVVSLDDPQRDGPRSRREVLVAFDFGHQHKDSYDDCVAAFENAVRRRAVDGCYLPLSAGYDSGAIQCALAHLGVDHKAWSIVGEENLDLLGRRNTDGEILDMDDDTFTAHKELLRRHAETSSFRLRIVNDEGEARIYDPLEDNACAGLSLIHSLAREEERRVSLSGTGAEILSALRGRWPSELRPWPDFAGRMLTAWLSKEEVAAGAYGVEVRYPFLDRTLVQEFLWLTPELKNRFYKAPLHVYMTGHGYPFDLDVKTGFIPIPEDD